MNENLIGVVMVVVVVMVVMAVVMAVVVVMVVVVLGREEHFQSGYEEVGGSTAMDWGQRQWC
jgi:uncharacterized membrane protein